MMMPASTRRLGPASTALATAATAAVASIAAVTLVAMSAMAFEVTRLDVLEAVPDGGGAVAGVQAVPLEQYLAGLQPAPDEHGTDAANSTPKFPLVSALRRGVLPAPVVGVMPARWMGSPVFLLGADEASAKWLRHNLRALRAMHAMGLVVQADSARNLGALQSLGDGLPLAPAQSPWLQRRLIAAGVSVYPVLIQADGSVIQIVPSGLGAPAPASTSAPVVSASSLTADESHAATGVAARSPTPTPIPTRAALRQLTP